MNTGQYEAHTMSDAAFDNMQRTYDRLGYAMDPATGQWMGDLNQLQAHQGVFPSLQDCQIASINSFPRQNAARQDQGRQVQAQETKGCREGRGH